jgi:hypothetical protein
MTYTGPGDGGDGGGQARRTDALTAQEAARLVDARGLMLLILRHLYNVRFQSRNGWELAVALGMSTKVDSVRNRMVALVRQEAVRIEGTRPGQTGVAGQAYIITRKGIQILAGEVKLITNPPIKPWEKKKVLQGWARRIANGDYSDELRDEIVQAMADYYQTYA